MSQEKITFRIDSDRKAALDAIAAGMKRDPSYVLNEAVAAYLKDVSVANGGDSKGDC
ncbi:MAG: ribbon-helix-helix domain-containing protein [Nostoc sp.]